MLCACHILFMPIGLLAFRSGQFTRACTGSLLASSHVRLQYGLVASVPGDFPRAQVPLRLERSSLLAVTRMLHGRAHAQVTAGHLCMLLH